MYSHILICTDGSDLAKSGVDHGLSLARALASKVTIIMATEPFPLALGGASSAGWVASPEDFEGYDNRQKEYATGVLAAAKAAAQKTGVAVDTIYVPGVLPATAIVETAQKLGCNLIVMASHGRRGISRVLLGSQTAEVLATTKVPVLVVR
jgi:nucleotide-binding universal stress UspA family protein